MIVVIAATILQLSLSSTGDRDPEYILCVRDCYYDSEKSYQEYSAWMRALYWDHLSECRYQCMRRISDAREVQGQSTLKYFGHWPYHRILGIQEPASAVFSFANALPHIYNLTSRRHRFNNPDYYMGGWVLLYGSVAVVAWFCSTVFHARKIGIAIDLDYMSALLFILTGLWVALRRTLHTVFRHSRLLTTITFGTLLMLGLSRVARMAEGSISFDQHMEVSIAVAAAQAVVWTLWALFVRPPHWKLCLLLQVWFGIASMLELFDFPPVMRHFDAHSLWHAATVPLGFLWYEFWATDCKYCIESSSGVEKTR